MKTNFVSTVSHELRTPLTSIKGALNLLLDGHIEDRDTMREFLKIAEQNTDRLIALISSLLDLSRMESGRVGMRFGRLDMNQLTASVIKSTSVLAKQSGVNIESACDEDAALVLGDRDRIEQVLVNLIGNAIKFSEPGSKVRVLTDISEDEVRLAVEDEGVGIPKDKLEKVFDRFYQVDMSATRRIGGTGLGLTICKAIVKEHGGRIWAESPATPDGRGARFVMSLPKGDLPTRDSSELVKQALLKEGPIKEGGGGKTVLVVDDDPGILKIHKRAFEQEGYHVLTAMTGKDALRLAREKRPGFIFLDVLLPDLDGFDVASILRSDPETRDTPIVFTTVLGEEGREKGLNLGSGYITKPFNEEQLISAVRRIIK
jgi:CheY-like chemotaxis protein